MGTHIGTQILSTKIARLEPLAHIGTYIGTHIGTHILPTKKRKV